MTASEAPLAGVRLTERLCLSEIKEVEMNQNSIHGEPTDAQRMALALKAMEAFTPAIDAALWVALMWNDHNNDHSTILHHAERAAYHLGLKRGGPDQRDELFALWNDALAALSGGEGDRSMPRVQHRRRPP
jgi:hypothetical protein